MKSLAFLVFFLISPLFAQNYMGKVKNEILGNLNCQASEVKENHCINQFIITDAENISDLLKVVSDFSNDQLDSEREYIISLWELKQKVPEETLQDFTYLQFQVQAFQLLFNCLYEDDYQSRNIFEIAEDQIPLDEHFYFGHSNESLNYILKKKFYICMIKKKYSQKDLEKDCFKHAIHSYFDNDLIVQLERMKKEYPFNNGVDSSYANFKACVENDREKAWDCFKTLNHSLIKRKTQHLINVLKLEKSVSLKIADESFEDYLKCHEGSLQSTSSMFQEDCRSSLFYSLREELVKNVAEKDHDFFLDSVLKQCQKHGGLKNETNCLSAINLAKTKPKHLEMELFFHNQKIIDQTWKESIIDSYGSELETLNFLINRSEARDIMEDVPDLTVKEIQCINKYTGSGYMDMNKTLWSSGTNTHNSDRDMGYIGCAKSGLRKIISASKKNKKLYKKTLYRGVNSAPFTDRFSTDGECIVFTGFTSTSHDEDSSFNESYNLIIKNCPQDSNEAGALISPFSRYEGEDEVLFLPGTRFRVTKSVYDDGYDKKVELECITEEQMKKDKLECY